MDAVQEQIILWQRNNPLRLWRERNNLTMRSCAPRIPTSMNSIQDWEQGQYRPRIASYKRLAKAMSFDDYRTLMILWAEWWESRPIPLDND